MMAEKLESLIRTMSETSLRRSIRTPLGFDKERSMMSLNSFNVVLCGRREEKSSAYKAISGDSAPDDGSGPLGSVVELPALYRKSQVVAREESLKCISDCGPYGEIHAFILVLPLGHITDEDKKELETIQNTFGPAVNDFIMIMFTVKSDPTDRDHWFIKENKDTRDLFQRCRGRYCIVNIQSKQSLSQVVDAVKEMTAEGSRCFTKDMFTQTQIEKITSLEGELQGVASCVRMVLIGKTGGGKSATANTIFGRKVFNPSIVLKNKSTTCQIAKGEVDGRPVTLVNTPGLFKTTLSKEEMELELKKCLEVLAPGPHVFLLVLQIGGFSEEEKNSMETIKCVFGEQAQNYTMIVFTRGEEVKGQSFDAYLEECDPFVKKLVEDCGRRYVFFNNTDQTNRGQVRELLVKIDDMVLQNGGSCYSMAPQGSGVLGQMMENANKEEIKQIKELEKKICTLEQGYKDSGETNKALRDELKKMKEELERQKKKEKSGCSIA